MPHQAHEPADHAHHDRQPGLGHQPRDQLDDLLIGGPRQFGRPHPDDLHQPAEPHPGHGQDGQAATVSQAGSPTTVEAGREVREVMFSSGLLLVATAPGHRQRQQAEHDQTDVRDDLVALEEIEVSYDDPEAEPADPFIDQPGGP